ncbi:hypothetical protein [Mycobacterium sp. E136]|uniref:hypothetical protein n=1 Tax=Mycobacterium sp. E136 TaxID=1834125 RepID=UPI0012E7667E|nr:hypothetical protein [Mycobacterium sp. E136]
MIEFLFAGARTGMLGHVWPRMAGRIVDSGRLVCSPEGAPPNVRRCNVIGMWTVIVDDQRPQ